ncbi:MAG: hypothetical protein KDD33_01095 [Bdellovibrionales bacterium]|nr:hypothetical protein [Bdellovibrionales bacterium]
MLKKIILLMATFSLVACQNGWDQDPFSGDPDQIKNAVKQGSKPKAVPPIQTAIFIELDEFYDFKEDEKRVIKTGYRLTHPEYKLVSFDIPGLQEKLPGAVFDQQKMEIDWTPPKGYVLAGRLITRTPLTIVALLEFDGITHEYRKSTSINVLRANTARPSILEVKGDKGPYKEGKAYQFEVIVDDAVSSRSPVLAVVNRTSGSENATPYLQYQKEGFQDPNVPGRWSFPVTLNLIGAEVTPSDKILFANFIAYSEYGAESEAFESEFSVITELKAPRFFKQDSIEFKKGQFNSYSFTIADVKSEGRVTGQWITDCSRLDGIADCYCDPGPFRATCWIKWTPEKEGTTTMEVLGKNEIDNPNVKQSIPKKESFDITVVN